jgi:hypothetical protein
MSDKLAGGADRFEHGKLVGPGTVLVNSDGRGIMYRNDATAATNRSTGAFNAQ